MKTLDTLLTIALIVCILSMIGYGLSVDVDNLQYFFVTLAILSFAVMIVGIEQQRK